MHKITGVVLANMVTVGLWLSNHSGLLTAVSAILAGGYTCLQIYSWFKNKK
jgi:hypothetical protein